mmetsp:Transcript_23489/g.39344  ORF Transcript_23489/g.39344 Transcript_23489/m.39344 type:complete len:254 (+) Transcript_23489:182-943(+)
MVLLRWLVVKELSGSEHAKEGVGQRVRDLAASKVQHVHLHLGLGHVQKAGGVVLLEAALHQKVHSAGERPQPRLEGGVVEVDLAVLFLRWGAHDVAQIGQDRVERLRHTIALVLVLLLQADEQVAELDLQRDGLRLEPHAMLAGGALLRLLRLLFQSSLLLYFSQLLGRVLIRQAELAAAVDAVLLQLDLDARRGRRLLALLPLPPLHDARALLIHLRIFHLRQLLAAADALLFLQFRHLPSILLRFLLHLEH